MLPTFLFHEIKSLSLHLRGEKKSSNNKYNKFPDNSFAHKLCLQDEIWASMIEGKSSNLPWNIGISYYFFFFQPY